MEVHKKLGCGFLEVVYQEALAKEFEIQKIIFEREVELPVFYKADFICRESIVIECKALSKLTSVEDAQIINYLKATNYTKGILLNFGSSRLEYKRFIHTSSADKGVV